MRKKSTIKIVTRAEMGTHTKLTQIEYNGMSGLTYLGETEVNTKSGVWYTFFKDKDDNKYGLMNVLPD